VSQQVQIARELDLPGFVVFEYNLPSAHSLLPGLRGGVRP